VLSTRAGQFFGQLARLLKMLRVLAKHRTRPVCKKRRINEHAEHATNHEDITHRVIKRVVMYGGKIMPRSLNTCRTGISVQDRHRNCDKVGIVGHGRVFSNWIPRSIARGWSIFWPGWPGCQNAWFQQITTKFQQG